MATESAADVVQGEGEEPPDSGEAKVSPKASANPKMFVSYSWTSQDHENRVLQLATELCESGVDVLLDKWDLREGHDAHAFMERMVTDPEIRKVAIVSDSTYAAKADGREGGVGTETQIITPEIYKTQDQSKFVAVVMERHDDGTPCLPTYYKSRIYIDLSDASSYAAEFEKIVRWAYDQPLHTRPPLGRKPEFLIEDERHPRLSTGARFKRAIDALRNSRDYAVAALDEYLSVLAEEVERFRISEQVGEFDDQVLESISNFTPYRDEAISAFSTLALYRDDTDTRRVLHRFFERLVPYLSRPADVSSWQEWSFDNFRFLIHELYLYAIASSIKHERFETASILMGEFYVPGRSDYGSDVMVSYGVFREYLTSFEHRNKRLGLRRLSLRADLLKERCKGLPIDFTSLMQADFVLFLRSHLEGHDYPWWPETLLYSGRFSGTFEVFARSRSAAYFDRAKLLLGIKTKRDLDDLLIAFNSGTRRLPRWEHSSFNLERLLGHEMLASKP